MATKYWYTYYDEEDMKKVGDYEKQGMKTINIVLGILHDSKKTIASGLVPCILEECIKGSILNGSTPDDIKEMVDLCVESLKRINKL